MQNTCKESASLIWDPGSRPMRQQHSLSCLLCGTLLWQPEQAPTARHLILHSSQPPALSPSSLLCFLLCNLSPSNMSYNFKCLFIYFWERERERECACMREQERGRERRQRIPSRFCVVSPMRGLISWTMSSWCEQKSRGTLNRLSHPGAPVSYNFKLYIVYCLSLPTKMRAGIFAFVPWFISRA